VQKTGQVTLETTAGQHAFMGVFVFVVFLEYVCFATSGRIESETHFFAAKDLLLYRCTYVHMCMYKCACVYVYIYEYIDVHMCMCVCTYVHVSMYEHIHKYICMCINIRTCKLM